MKLKASVCGVIAAVAILGTAGGHGKEGSRFDDGAPEPDLHEKLDVYVGQLKHGSVKERREAVVALGRIAERAKGAEAVPLLEKALKAGAFSTRSWAAATLWKMKQDPAAVAAMTADLKNKDLTVRREAAEALGRFGVGAKAAVPALVEALNDTRWYVSHAAALSLWQIDKHPDAIPTLVPDLMNPDGQTERASAARALGQIGPDAKSAVPALLEALKDKPWTAWYNSGFHIPVAQALWQIEKHPAAIRALIECVKNCPPNRRGEAAMALRTLGIDAKAAMTELLKDENPEVRQNAAANLVAMGAEADAKFVADLIVTAREWPGPDERVPILGSGRMRIGAATMLWQINKHPAAALALAEVLKDPDPEIAASAAEWLYRIGPEAKPVAPALKGALKSKNQRTRYYAAKALARLGAEAEAVPVLVELLKDKDAHWRHLAAFSLWRINKDPAALTVLLADLKDKEMRASAAYTLWDMNRHPAVVPALLEDLKNGSSESNHLIHIGLEGHAAVAALTDALKDEDEAVRNAAAQWLKRIDPDAVRKAGVK